MNEEVENTGTAKSVSHPYPPLVWGCWSGEGVTGSYKRQSPLVAYTAGMYQFLYWLINNTYYIHINYCNIIINVSPQVCVLLLSWLNHAFFISPTLQKSGLCMRNNCFICFELCS